MEFSVEERHCLALKPVTHPVRKALPSTAGSEETVKEGGVKYMKNYKLH